MRQRRHRQGPRAPEKALHRISPLKYWLRRLGPGLVTGAADDDPSGVATYSQAGAQFGTALLWTVVFTYPFMVTIQAICARIGRVTGRGLTANMLDVLPRGVVAILVALLLVANTINIGADLVAMGAAAGLIVGRGESLFAIAFALGSLALQIFVPYHRYVHFLKWMTLALFAYVGVVFFVVVDWASVVRGAMVPNIAFDSATLTVVVAVFGTTISPYLFFWQCAEEVEDASLSGSDSALLHNPKDAPEELSRIAGDTIVGMGFSNIISFFIILTTAMTLHVAGVRDIETSAQAAQALRPIAGDFAFFLFSLGIIGTGLLALPVLAASGAYAVGELLGWRIGLEEDARNAKGFYGVIAFCVLAGLSMLFLPIDPIKALFWSAVLNGVIAVPLMAATMLVASDQRRLGLFVARPLQQWLGWIATGLMAAAAVAMFTL